ncbi:RhuM family protein [Pseudochelatococcus sp. G4_1912]|uniref:RhuM family protein n=1 Tax=Pseudochelatococcus sp. G4_1912 TaxID=3114288 RepID=UPI0039C5AFE9
MSKGEFILYNTEDGVPTIGLRAIEGAVWLTQAQIAELFQTSTQAITRLIAIIYADGEADEAATCKKLLQVRTEGGREVSRKLKHYNLDIIHAIGYRVRSTRGVQFRRWATAILREYMVKGFAMDDARLKQVEQWDYFDECLARIHDIRTSQKRFYQKLRNLYTTAIDYDKTSEQAETFFKKVQNKMLWAITGMTTNELIETYKDPNACNMGITNWKSSTMNNSDVGNARDYLKIEEVEELNRIVVMYLDYAEKQAKRRHPITMAEWSDKLNTFLSFNERNVLTHVRQLRMDVAQELAAGFEMQI